MFSETDTFARAICEHEKASGLQFPPYHHMHRLSLSFSSLFSIHTHTFSDSLEVLLVSPIFSFIFVSNLWYSFVYKY